jgi:hypothetical protein
MSVFTPIIVEADLALAAAAGVPETPLGEAPFAATVTSVKIVSESALTAADATARTLTIYNRGQAGAGTTVVATLVTNLAGGNWVANVEKDFTLSATPANLVLAAGDNLECVETVASTGTARGASKITIRGTRNS